MTTLLRTVTLLALFAPTAAFAGKVVLTPLLMDPSVNAKQRLAVHQLISSELDFAPEVDGVVELDATPPGLDEACLANPKCLGGIASANAGAQVVAGKMSASGDNFVLDVVFYDGTKIARRKQFTVPQDATALANAITPIVHEVLTGSGLEDQTAANPSHDFAGDDDLAIGGAELVDAVIDTPAPPPPAPKKAAPAPAPVAKAPPPPPPPAPVPDRRVAAATVATGLATGGTAAAPPAPSDDELAQMISFGGSATDITAEQIASNIKFGAPPPSTPAPQPLVRSSPPSSASASRGSAGDDDRASALSSPTLTDLDGRRPATHTTSSKPPTTSHSGGGSSDKGDMGHVVQLTGRAGFTKYYKFNFLSAGGEAAVDVFNGLHLLAGMEVYGVKRVLPPNLQISTGIYSQWNYIFPMNVGAIYKIPLGLAQPYVGADAIFVQYYKDQFGADWAGGGRVRAGSDFMIIPNFGFNVNLALGAWSGANWGLIEQGVGKTGLLPEISAGTVFAF